MRCKKCGKWKNSKTFSKSVETGKLICKDCIVEEAELNIMKYLGGGDDKRI